MKRDSNNNVRKMGEKFVRCDDATNMHGRGGYRNFGIKYPKEKLYSEDIMIDRNHKHNTVEPLLSG